MALVAPHRAHIFSFYPFRHIWKDKREADAFIFELLLDSFHNTVLQLFVFTELSQIHVANPQGDVLRCCVCSCEWVSSQVLRALLVCSQLVPVLVSLPFCCKLSVLYKLSVISSLSLTQLSMSTCSVDLTALLPCVFNIPLSFLPTFTKNGGGQIPWTKGQQSLHQ